eukprot:m.6691 g.6691  ORF g.6691 m.6691 type:complete len:98 (+) comp16593_c0_seq1:703-996(+)
MKMLLTLLGSRDVEQLIKSSCPFCQHTGEKRRKKIVSFNDYYKSEEMTAKRRGGVLSSCTVSMSIPINYHPFFYRWNLYICLFKSIQQHFLSFLNLP